MSLAELRLRSFRRWHPADPALTEVGRQLSSHAFLANPAGQQPYRYLTDFTLQVLKERVGSSPRVLDWGCGKGQVSYLLSQAGIRPVCADVPDSEPVRPLLQRAGLTLQALTDPVQLPFPSDSFDAVVSFGVLEHVPDDAGSLREIARVLRPGGWFFCYNLPYAYSWIMWLAHRLGNHYHDRLYTRASARALTAQAGLDLEHMWLRQLFPKNRVSYPWPQAFERLDQLLTEHTPLRHLATSLEFVARRS